MFVSSAASRVGSPGMYVDYAASKGAIDTLTHRPRPRRWPTEGVRVNAVRPGIIRTEIHADSGDVDRPAKAASSLPMGRPGEPEEVAAAIAWLMSDEAGYIDRRDPRRERRPLMADVRRARPRTTSTSWCGCGG